MIIPHSAPEIHINRNENSIEACIYSARRFLYRIHCSSACYDILQKLGGYELSARGVTSIKGKTDQMTYWLVREDPYIRARRDGFKQYMTPTNILGGAYI